MPQVVPFIPLLTAGVGVVGGLMTGNQQAKQNQQYIQGQDRQYAQVGQFAQQLLSTVNRAEYDAQANKDVNAAMKDVFGVMASRGMGRSTAGLTASADVAGKIRSTYTQQYFQDRMGAIQGAGNMLAGVASAPRMGYDSHPYAGFQSGLSGIANAAAYYGEKGWPQWGSQGGGTRDPGFSYSYGGGTGLGTTPVARTYYGT